MTGAEITKLESFRHVQCPKTRLQWQCRPISTGNVAELADAPDLGIQNHLFCVSGNQAIPSLARSPNIFEGICDGGRGRPVWGVGPFPGDADRARLGSKNYTKIEIGGSATVNARVSKSLQQHDALRFQF
jgi:hypothetical protein